MHVCNCNVELRRDWFESWDSRHASVYSKADEMTLSVVSYNLHSAMSLDTARADTDFVFLPNPTTTAPEAPPHPRLT